jgi:signal transduction histidine kinase
MHAPSQGRSPEGRAQRQIRLRSALTGLSLSGVLPLLVFASALLWMQWQSRQEQGRRELQQIVRTLAVAVELEIDGSIRQLEDMSESPALTPESLERFHEYMKQLTRRRRGWENLTLIRADGVHVANSGLAFGDDLPPRADLPHGRVFETGAPVVTGLFTSRRSNVPGVAILVPVRRDGGVRWVLGARLSLEHLGSVLSSTLARADAVAAIIDASGRLVARTRAHEQFVGQPAPDAFRRLVDGAPRGVARTQTLDAGDALVAWERLARGWTVAHAVPLDEIEAPLRRSMLLLAGFGTALLMAVLAAARAMSNRIGGEVDAAADDADELAAERAVGNRVSAIVEVDRLFDAHQRAGVALAQARAERKLANSDLQHAMARLRDAVDHRDRFMAMLAHELRNPLAPLTTALHLMKRRGRLDDTDRAMRDMGERQARQLARLVDDLLDASRLATGKIRLQPAPMPMSGAVREAAEAARPVIAARAQRLVVEVPAEPLGIVGDRARIAQVLHNLLGNAAKFGQAGGTVRLALRVDGPDAVVTVSDDGVGIDPSRLGDLFEPFSQIDPSLDRTNGGLGLGLSVVRELVEMHGGSVRADSTGLGGGATFTVRLPLAAGAA